MLIYFGEIDVVSLVPKILRYYIQLNTQLARTAGLLWATLPLTW